MADPDDMATALAMAETCVQDMAEAGIQPQQIAIALAQQMQAQAALLFPDMERRAVFLSAISQPVNFK